MVPLDVRSSCDSIAQCPIRRGSGQILGCGFLGLNPLLSGPRNGFWSIFGHLIEFGLVTQLSKQPQNGFYKVNQDMGRKFKTARIEPPVYVASLGFFHFWLQIGNFWSSEIDIFGGQ